MKQAQPSVQKSTPVERIVPAQSHFTRSFRRVPRVLWNPLSGRQQGWNPVLPLFLGGDQRCSETRGAPGDQLGQVFSLLCYIVSGHQKEQEFVCPLTWVNECTHICMNSKCQEGLRARILDSQLNLKPLESFSAPGSRQCAVFSKYKDNPLCKRGKCVSLG